MFSKNHWILDLIRFNCPRIPFIASLSHRGDTLRAALSNFISSPSFLGRRVPTRALANATFNLERAAVEGEVSDQMGSRRTKVDGIDERHWTRNPYI